MFCINCELVPLATKLNQQTKLSISKPVSLGLFSYFNDILLSEIVCDGEQNPAFLLCMDEGMRLLTHSNIPCVRLSVCIKLLLRRLSFPSVLHQDKLHLQQLQHFSTSASPLPATARVKGCGVETERASGRETRPYREERER